MATVTRYIDPDATGAGDGTSWGDAYTSMNAWEAAEQTDLVSAGDSHVVYCRSSSGTADTVAVVISGWTTDSTNYITIICDNDTGIWDASKYRLDVAGASSAGVLTLSNIDLEVLYWQMHNSTNSDASAYGLYVIGSTTGEILFDSCILNSNDEGSALHFYSTSPALDFTIRNSLIYCPHTQGGSSEGIYIYVIDSAANVAVQNCVVYNFNDGIERDSGSVTVTNSAVFGNADDFDGTMTISYCDSDDGDGSNAQTLDSSSGYANEFNDVSSFDFSLVAGSSCIDTGTDLSGTFTNDITGATRSGTWEIGAFLYSSGGTGHVKGLDDTISLSDARILLYSLSESDGITISDDKDFLSSLSRSDNITTSDDKDFAFSLPKSDNITTSDDKDFVFSLPKSDNIATSDDKNFSSLLSKNDDITVSDNTQKGINSIIADNISLNESENKTFSNSYSDSIAISENLYKSFQNVYADSLSFSDNFSRACYFIRSSNEIINVNDSIVKRMGVIKNDSVSLADNFSKAIDFLRSLSDSLNLSDSDSKNYNKTSSDSLNLSDDINTIIAIFIYLVDSVNLTESVTKTQSIINSDSISLEENISKTAAFVRTLNEAVNLTDLLEKTVGIVESDSISINDNINTVLTLLLTLIDSIELADSAYKKAEVSLSDSSTLSESFGYALDVAPTASSLYSSLQDTTAKLLLNFGRSVDLVKIATGTFDPETGLTTGDDESTETVKAVFTKLKFPWGKKPSTVEAGDCMALVSADGAEPEQNDTIDGWAILSVEKVTPAATTVLYKCHVRSISTIVDDLTASGGLYGNLQSSVYDLLSKFGQSVSLVKTTAGTFDSETGLHTDDTTTTSIVKAVFTGIEYSWGKTNFVIEEGDTIVLVSALGESPEKTDLIDGWTILDVEKVKPADIIVLYKCHARKQ